MIKKQKKNTRKYINCLVCTHTIANFASYNTTHIIVSKKKSSNLNRTRLGKSIENTRINQKAPLVMRRAFFVFSTILISYSYKTIILQSDNPWHTLHSELQSSLPGREQSS